MRGGTSAQNKPVPAPAGKVKTGVRPPRASPGGVQGVVPRLQCCGSPIGRQRRPSRGPTEAQEAADIKLAQPRPQARSGGARGAAVAC
jgi:hypothetical protein